VTCPTYSHRDRWRCAAALAASLGFSAVADAEPPALPDVVISNSPLPGPMIDGDKRLPPGTPVSRDTPGRRVAALVLMSACAVLVTFVVRLGG
jgi:hypothetical protein